MSRTWYPSFRATAAESSVTEGRRRLGRLLDRTARYELTRTISITRTTSFTGQTPNGAAGRQR
jgi:hypothetical protein